MPTVTPEQKAAAVLADIVRACELLTQGAGRLKGLLDELLDTTPEPPRRSSGERAVKPMFYKMGEVEKMLNLSYQTVCRLIVSDILVASGRGKGRLISAESLDSLVAHMQQGGDKWDAPRMRVRRLPLDAGSGSTATAHTGKAAKTSDDRPSRKTAGSRSSEPLTSKPPKRVLESLIERRKRGEK